MIGINGYEFIILIVLALVLLGPERLPEYAQTLGRWVRQARGMAEDAKVRFREETGTDFDEIEWQKYDPRQYDPRRIIREALSEEYEETRQAVSSVTKAAELEAGGSARSRGSRSSSSRSSAGRSRRRLSSSRGSGAGARNRPAPDRAGRAGAAKRADDDADPRAIFSSAEAAPAGSALAAGMAGAAADGRTAALPEEGAEEQQAPFDAEAT